MSDSTALDDLPSEVLDLLQKHEEEKIVKLDAFSRMVAKKRDGAVIGRQNSGVEQIWVEDDEHYLGIDGANRGKNAYYKPLTPTGGFSPKGTGRKNDTRSTVFLNITRPYVDAIVARTCDILLPTDDKNWGIQPTPVPELIKALQDKTPLPPVPQTGAAVPQTGAPSQMGMAMPNPGTPPVPQATIADAVQQVMANARESAGKAETRIDDWLAECGYNGEVRKVIFDAAKLGVGILKGPCPELRKSTAVKKGPNGVSVEMSVEIKPASKRIDPWNFFPDPACGENIHDGNHCFELDYLTAKSLRELKGSPGYDDKAIDSVIEQGPVGRSKDSGAPSRRTDDKDLYEVWYGEMFVGKEDLGLFGVDVKDLKSDSINAIVTIVNDTAIKAVPAPLSDGKFTYDVIPWQRVAGMWAGVGVSRQIRTPQQATNAAHRNCLDNAGLSGGPILIVRQNRIIPADGDWQLRPRKVFYATADSDERSVNDAITVVNVPSQQEALMNIIQFELKTAELVTGFPLLMQGQANPQSTPDTYGGQMLATQNASTVLRHIARTFDDYITRPHLERYYAYLLEYGDDDSEKGDFQIIARGASALVEHEIAVQEQLQLLQMCNNPAFGLDPKKVMHEWFLSRRFDPAKFQYSPEELAKIAAQPAPPPLPIAVATIKAKAETDVATIKTQASLQELQVEHQLESDPSKPSPAMLAAQAKVASAQIQANSEQEKERARANWELQYVENERLISQQNSAGKLQELELKRQLALLDYANKKDLTLVQVKAELAKVSMQEATKRELAGASAQVQANTATLERTHDLNKHVMNIQSNQDTAAAQRLSSDQAQSAQHEHEAQMLSDELQHQKDLANSAPAQQ